MSKLHWSARGGWLLALALAGVPTLGVLLRSDGSGSPLGPRTVLAAAETVIFIPAAAQLAGAAGTNWRTDLEIVNPAAGQASYTVALLKRDTDNTSPATRSYTLEAGRAVRYANVLSTMFAYSGAAALRITVNSGTILASSRTYNTMVAGNPLNLPAGSTFGQFVPAFAAGQAVVAGENAYLIQLAHTPNPFTGQREGFRTNLGYVNATGAALGLTVDLYTAAGVKLGSFSDSLPPYGYKQVDKVFERVTAQPVTDGYAIVRTTTAGGAFVAYASVVDNAVGDPIFVPAQKAAALPPAATPTPTVPPAPTVSPTPSRTPTPPAGARVNLVPYKPTGWDYPIVPSMEQGTTTVGFLSVHYNTYVDWAVLNEGPDNIPGRINFELRLDGQRLQRWYADSLPANYYVRVLDYVIPYGTLTTGAHTLTIVADYDNQIAETNEADNSWGKSWEWSNIMFMLGDPRAARGTRVAAPGPSPLEVLRREIVPVEPTAGMVQVNAGQTLFIPTAAQLAGAAGTNWRTDLAIVNPAAGQASYTVALLKRDTDNASPQTRSYTLEGGRAVRYANVLSTMFAYSGAAALRITVNSGTILASSRTYNTMVAGNPLNLPAGSTFGQFVPAFAAGQAVVAGENAYLIQLAHTPNPFTGQREGFRTNLGYVNATAAALALTVDLYSAAGVKLGSFSDSLPPYGYKQVDKVFERVTGQAVADGYAVVRTTTAGGAFFAYASVIDNVTGDPVFVPAERVGASAGSYIEIGRATIGPAGGTLAGDGCTLTVPAGAFASSATLVLTKADAAAAASAPYARYAISPLYGIDGLPDTFTQPLTITITLTGSGSTGNRYVALTELVFSPSAAGVIQGPILLDATTVGANQLRAIIPATPAGSGAAPSEGFLASGWTNRELLVETRPAFSVRAISGIYAQETTDGRFRIYYPAVDLITGGSDAILDALSSAYTKLPGLGLSWAGRTRWPIEAEIYSFPADERDRDAQETPSRMGVNYHWLAFNLDRMGTTADLPRMKVAAGHELFHLMQFLYDPRNRWTQARQPGTWLWIDEASATWFESLMAGSESYVPGTVREDNYSFLVRRGLEYPPGDPSNVQGHGYGASMFLKHLTKSKGNTFVGDLYKLHPNASYTPVDAISRTLGSSIDTENQWKLFTEGWTEGRIYPGTTFPSLIEVLGSKSATYTFDSQDDTGQTFTWNAPDLAARVYVVNLRYTGWQPGTSLPISLTDPNKSAQAVIYKYKSGDVTPTRLGSIKDRENYDVANAEQLARDGYSLLIVVANGRNQNPYTGTSPIELKVGFGTIAFRLSWGGVEDLDLHVQEPNGTEIYYGNTGPTSTGGRLDTDCNGPCSHQCASPVENVYWPSGGAPPGTYRFWVHYYSNCSGGGEKAFTLKVFVNGQLKQTYSDTLAGEGAESTVYSYTL